MDIALPVTGIALIVVMEVCTWMLFRKHVEGLHFPRAMDTSQLKFFTISRIRACAVVHGVFLLTSTAFLFSLAW